jgi:hypothetical protein
MDDLRIDGTDWNHLAQNRFQWRTLVNTVMNLQVPFKARTLLHGVRYTMTSKLRVWTGLIWLGIGSRGGLL